MLIARASAAGRRASKSAISFASGNADVVTS
jgi:hypothetical protein